MKTLLKLSTLLGAAKKLVLRIIIPLGLAMGSSGSWAFLILNGPGAGDDVNVGSLDVLEAVQQGPFNGGTGNPSGEESWAESVLGGIDLVFDAKVETISIFDTDTAGIRAFALSSQPGYFVLKNATWRALFQNVASLDWAVINKDALAAGFNLNGATISHATEFNDADPDPDPDPVPVPGTLLLLGLGILGLGLSRKRQSLA